MRARNKSAAVPIEVQIDDPSWRVLGSSLIAEVRRAAKLALTRADGVRQGAGLTLLLTSDLRVQALNRQYRGKDKPTNVLSFPSRSAGYLGDIAIAYGVTAGEAKAAKLPLLHHVLHLTVHGVLHLLDYDHESQSDAEIMEGLEAEVLAEMDIPNPYRRRGRAA